MFRPDSSEILRKVCFSVWIVTHPNISICKQIDSGGWHPKAAFQALSILEFPASKAGGPSSRVRIHLPFSFRRALYRAREALLLLRDYAQIMFPGGVRYSLEQLRFLQRQAMWAISRWPLRNHTYSMWQDPRDSVFSSACTEKPAMLRWPLL